MRTVLLAITLLISIHPLRSQTTAERFTAKSAVFNVLLSGLSGGIGAVINKPSDQKWHKAFGKGFLVGSGGGALMFTGKKMNALIAEKNEPGYAWLSRSVSALGIQ